MGWGMKFGKKPKGARNPRPQLLLGHLPWNKPQAGALWKLCPGACEQGRGPPSSLGVPPQVWQCGGSMEVLPCSRVAHIERTKKPYNNDIDYYAKRNALRAAEVWMDSFKSHVYMAWNIPMTVSGEQQGKGRGRDGGGAETGEGGAETGRGPGEPGRGRAETGDGERAVLGWGGA